MKEESYAALIANSRKPLRDKAPSGPFREAEEGGCGVTGFACNIPVSGRHIIEPSVQMHNRGNGKGGGIAAVGLGAGQLGVDQKTLDEAFLLQIALLDDSVLPDLEQRFIRPHFRVDHEAFIDTVGDYRDIPGMEVKPPTVKRYFVRVAPHTLARFQQEHGLQHLPLEKVEEEFVYQNTFLLNQAYYSSLGDKKAFVLSHGRNMMILKIVGYAEQVAQYYKLEGFKAHVWIAHQRYPTKGRVWHPGGAHPFVGLDEALVHNGDFANYYSVTEYLRQRNVYPLFLTDTEVSVQVFDLLNRVYGYPLEYIIEALAPTTEMDFDHLPEEKQRIYRHIQATQIHGSPDGPWFFIIARSIPRERRFQMIGITDTAMLRPQVFALQEGAFQVGLICSEKQAIDATLQSLASEDPRFGTIADRYWNARGGSYTDGGAFIFTISEAGEGHTLTCTDKFGREITIPTHKQAYDFSTCPVPAVLSATVRADLKNAHASSRADFFRYFTQGILTWDFEEIRNRIAFLAGLAAEEGSRPVVIELLTRLLDRRYPTGAKRRRSLLQMVTDALDHIFLDVPLITNGTPASGYPVAPSTSKLAGVPTCGSSPSNENLETPQGAFVRIDFPSRNGLRPPKAGEEVLVTDAGGFPAEGDEAHARLVCDAYALGWRRFICFGHRGQRFLGCGLGPETRGVRIDAYGSTGDYLGSGIDGLELYVHGNGQDQIGQILKSGKLVVYGDVGQTFMYGAKGGEVYVLGNAAGRPLINAAGRPRVVINGTALDFLAESFMAGDPYNGGGFVIVNGLAFDDEGRVVPQETPYPGSNLFSLASGGAIFVRDPEGSLVDEHLNGGQFLPFGDAEWDLIRPYLEENERLFGITVDELLTVNGSRQKPHEVYRMIGAVKLSVLAAGAAAALQEWDEEE
ncbi:MAG: glutamate synthase [Syntrophorhabdales bacterium]|jgi:glutamate synthase domain-containing protein 1